LNSLPKRKYFSNRELVGNPPWVGCYGQTATLRKQCFKPHLRNTSPLLLDPRSCFEDKNSNKKKIVFHYFRLRNFTRFCGAKSKVEELGWMLLYCSGTNCETMRRAQSEAQRKISFMVQLGKCRNTFCCGGSLERARVHLKDDVKAEIAEIK
jgi:hypothetical protein